MLLPAHTYHKPATLAECLKMLAVLNESSAESGGEGDEKVRVIAGGTDVIFNMRLRFFKPRNLVSIRRLPELQQVEELPDGGLRIGAGCRLADLLDNPFIVQRYPALQDSIYAVASTHIRNIGTLGGNICLETRCWYTNNSNDWRDGRDGCFKTDCQQCHVIPSSDICHAINNADTPLALIALGAMLTIQSSASSRDVPISQFYRRDGMAHMALESGELLTHITIPPCADRTVFIKFTPRKGMDFSLGAVSARCDGEGEHVENVTIVVGSISSSPIVLTGPARIIEQEGLTDSAIEKAVVAIRDELGEVTNLYARATYKKQIAKVLVKRALVALREQRADQGRG